MARREKPSERRHPIGPGGADDPLDLDVTPFLNIMFMLILSIMAMTSFTQLALLTVEAPKMGGSPQPPSDAAPVSQLNLTVVVLQTGFNLAASGASLDGNSENRPGEPLIPKLQTAQGSTYDYRALNKKLIEIKKAFPIEENIIFSADPDVVYDDVIHTMDAARETEDGKVLFPAVTFVSGTFG